MFIFRAAGKEELQSTEGFGEASRSGERAKCEATNDECHEVHAAFGSGSDPDSIEEDSDAGKPGTPTPPTCIQKR